LKPNGGRDAAFGGDGLAIHALSVNWEVDAVAVLRDHRIVGVNGFASGPNLVQLKAGGGWTRGSAPEGKLSGRSQGRSAPHVGLPTTWPWRHMSERWTT